MSDATVTDLLRKSSSRRRFLRDGGLLAVIAGAACKAAPKAAAALAQSPGGQTGGTMGPHDTSSAASATAADAMDEMHEKGIKAFPAKTAGLGNQLLAPKVVDGVKVFELTAKKIQWETEPGHLVEAWSYNDQVPGPQIRVREGDRVRVVLHNELPESTSIHFHGLELPNAMDGVPFITQPPVKPGQSFTYEFVVPNAGSHMYHSHHDSTKQVGLGLLGAFIVEPKVKSAHDNVDVDQVLILNDGAHGYTLNGKSFPATQPLVAKLGQQVRIRFMNQGMMIHPMHLQGVHMRVIAKDGWPVPAPWKCDALNVAPGERWDVIVHCTNPGTWAFHSHILPHAESEHGMYGMVTALVVNK
ncbi:MAG TPA: copper oxidase [Gemmatimonadaceae bacterium]|nr:copper oxidase [Gemmatimonadaceae bacterium]